MHYQKKEKKIHTEGLLGFVGGGSMHGAADQEECAALVSAAGWRATPQSYIHNSLQF